MEKVDKGDYTDSVTGKAIKDISFSITLKANVSGIIRTFGTYELKLMANSAPPDIKNAMFQLTEDGGGNYVLCFYLPKVKGTVHECDTKKIKIGSDTFYFKDTGSGVDFYTDEGCTTAADSTKIAASYSGSLYPAVPGISFSTPTSGYYPVYYFTETSMSADEIKYDIVLEDDFGLASSFGVSSKGEKLTEVIIPNETSYIGTEDGYYEIPLTHDGKTTTDASVSGVTIYYTVEQGGNVVASGSGASGVKVKLPSGKKGYSIKAVARKPYFVESDETSQSSINVQRSTIYYVSQNGKSPENGALGTKASPFRTIQQAVNDITTQATDFGLYTNGYTINLLTNLKAESLEDYGYSSGYSNYYVYMSCISSPFNNNSDKNLKLLIQGYGGSKVVDANYSGLDSQNAFEGKDYKIATVFNFDCHYQVTLKNLEITGGKGDTIGSSSAIHAAGRTSGCDFNSLTLENVKIYGNTGYRTTYINPVNFAATNVEIYNNDDAGLSGSSAGFQITNRDVSLKNVNIHHNCISNVNNANTTTLNGAGLNINSQNVTIEDLIVKNNKIKVKEGSSFVAKGAGVYLNCTPTIKGNCQIFDNEIENADNSKTTSNVYLLTGKTITVGGSLSGCTIGVTTENTPSSGITIPITNGYSTYNDGVPPARIFKSDAGYGAIMDESTGETVLATGGGSIDVPLQIYDDVKISVDKTAFLTKNTGNSLTVTSMVKPDSSYVNIPLNECTYSYELYNHGEKVNGIISTGSAKNIVNFNCASLPNESFELYVYLDYKGKKYQGVFPIEIYVGQGTPVTNSNEFKNALAAGGEIHLCKNTTVSDTLTIGGPCIINGNGKILKINRINLNTADSPYTVDMENITMINNGSCIFNVKQNVTLNLKKGAVIDFNNVPQGSTSVPTYNINVDGGFFNMEEGSCIKQSAASAAVFVKGNGIFTMNGGEICDNNCYRSPVYIYSAKAYINGGKIHDNKGTPAVYIAESTCEMNGGEIYSNIISDGTCRYNYNCSGAAIFCSADRRSNNVSFKMTGGKIYNNFAYNNGGALCLIAVNSEISGGEITNNVCGLHGGAIYNGRGVGSLAYKGTCTIRPNAKVENNFINASFNTANPDFTQGTEEKIYDTSNAADNVDEYRH